MLRKDALFRFKNNMNGSRVILAAHRGDRVNHPENSISAFKSAIDFGVDMIETDIRASRDGELVLIHDRSALRTSGVDKNIDEMSISEIKKLDIGEPFSSGYGIEKIPTLKEFIALIKNEKVLVNWELKVYPSDFGDDIAFCVADKLIELILENRLSERSMINSFSSRLLEYIRKRYGKKFILHGQGIYNCRRSKDKPKMPEEDFFDWCCLYPEKAGGLAIDNKENFDFCFSKGILPCICIADDFENYKKAIEYGCKMFTSNDIYKCDEILKKLGVR